MTSESLKFVDTSGYGTSGKSAVIELLQEFDGYYAASRDCEFELLRIHDGLIDLENALVHSWSPVRGSMALVKFEILVKNLGANPSLLNLFGQYNSYATKYDSRFNGKFVDLSMEYISNLTHVSYKSYLPHEYLLRSKLKYFFERFNFSPRTQINYKLDHLEKKDKIRFHYLLKGSNFQDRRRTQSQHLCIFCFHRRHEL